MDERVRAATERGVVGTFSVDSTEPDEVDGLVRVIDGASVLPSSKFTVGRSPWAGQLSRKTRSPPLSRAAVLPLAPRSNRSPLILGTCLFTFSTRSVVVSRIKTLRKLHSFCSCKVH